MKTMLCIGLMAVAPAVWAQEFPTTPQPETMQDAIRFQKNKDAADAAQARKEAGELAQQTQTSSKAASKTKSTTAKTKTESSRKTGQADSSKK
jgi:hypothetical protein